MSEATHSHSHDTGGHTVDVPQSLADFIRITDKAASKVPMSMVDTTQRKRSRTRTSS